MKLVKNTTNPPRPVDLESGGVLASGEFGEANDDDPSIDAGLLTIAVTQPEPDGGQPETVKSKARVKEDDK